MNGFRQVGCAGACGEPSQPGLATCFGCQGVKYACPECTIEGEYLNTFDDTALVKHVGVFYSQTLRADVTFGAGGLAGGYVINHTAAASNYVIGVDNDEYMSLFDGGKRAGADYILTSAMKAIDVATKAVVFADLDGEFRGGRTWVFDFSNSGVRLAPCHEACAVWSAYEDWERDLELQIATGVVHTGLDPDGVVLRTYAGANEWRTLPSFASPPSARKGQATPAVGDTWWDKSLFSFAGFTADGVTAELWAFELQDLTWRHLQPQTNLVRRFGNGSTTLEMGAQTAADVLPSPRVYSALVQHDGGTLVMFGGLSEEVQGVGRVALGDVWSLVKSAWLDRFHGIRARLGTQSDICRVCHSLQVPRTSRLKPMS